VLSDVAKLAGVSTATVSRVYNEPDKVSANVRERVEHAALTLNWFPNAAGRALASTRSHIAGIIIPTLDDRVFASQVSGMQAAFAARGITLVLGCSNYDPAQWAKLIRPNCSMRCGSTACRMPSRTRIARTVRTPASASTITRPMRRSPNI
jgi:LacI family transcriptional regulator